MYHDVTHAVSQRETQASADDPSDEAEKKERVIHTRVPESLETELRKRAQELGISVSNLVRNVLGHAFGLVGDVVADSHAIARAARGETDRCEVGGRSSATTARSATKCSRGRAIVLGKNAVCSRCNDLLPRGGRRNRRG